VVGAPPWNKLHEAVRWTVHEIRRLCPEREFGTRSIARHVVRAGCAHRLITNSAPEHLKNPRYAYHVWHMDITEFPVLWLRVHVVAIMDGFSRKTVALHAFKRAVTTAQIIDLLDSAIESVGRSQLRSRQ